MAARLASVPLSDDETVFRHLPRGPGHWEPSGDGKLRVMPTAFNDRGQKPSVDIARLCPGGVPQTLLSRENGVLRLWVRQVRGVKDVTVQDAKQHVVQVYAFDVVPRPIAGPPANPAHAQIEASPAFSSDRHFRKLRIALAIICTAGDQWQLTPEPIQS